MPYRGGGVHVHQTSHLLRNGAFRNRRRRFATARAPRHQSTGAICDTAIEILGVRIKPKSELGSRGLQNSNFADVKKLLTRRLVARGLQISDIALTVVL